ncbi:MAG: hypothetical protein FWF10_04185 [Clostridiales bacterium]|nr:hypothetical protein [Clostridiales bacterium]
MDKKKVFMMMPFKNEFYEVFEMLKCTFFDEFEFSHAGEEGNQQNILRDIIQPIYEANVIIADLTGLNPNVLYELGIAHTFNKKTIVITQDDLAALPFDLKQYRAKSYSTHFKQFTELVGYLSSNLRGAIDNSVDYGNPVKDFLTLEGVKTADWFSERICIPMKEDSEKGFIDFLVDIEYDTNSLSSSIVAMANELNEMTDGISRSTREINRVSNEGSSSGTATFIRKETKKVAKYVEEFSRKLKKRNSDLPNLWDSIEINILGLLENEFAASENNKQHMRDYLKKLLTMKKAIIEGGLSIEGLRASMQGNRGIERSLNQAIKFAEEDLATFSEIYNRIQASIDKIIKKSFFIIGSLNDAT